MWGRGAGLSVWPSEVAPCDTERLGLDTSRTRVFSPDRDDNGTHGEDYGPRLSDSAAICGAVSWGCCSFICSHKQGGRWAVLCTSAVPGTPGHPCAPCIPTCPWSPCASLGILHTYHHAFCTPQIPMYPASLWYTESLCIPVYPASLCVPTVHCIPAHP